jgi:hypothetical protein
MAAGYRGEGDCNADRFMRKRQRELQALTRKDDPKSEDGFEIHSAEADWANTESRLWYPWLDVEGQERHIENLIKVHEREMGPFVKKVLAAICDSAEESAAAKMQTVPASNLEQRAEKGMALNESVLKVLCSKNADLERESYN